MTTTSDLYSELVAILQKNALLASCGAVLGWDEQTNMPAGGSELRGNQLALISGMVHERATHPRVGELLSELESRSDLGEVPDRVVVVRESRRSYSRQTKLPQKLVEELSRTTSLAQQAWVAARKASDFQQFESWLDKVMALKREEAAAIGFGDGVPYDALLDEYEPGATAASIAATFATLREELVPLVAAIKDSGKQPDTSLLERRYPVDAQRTFATEAARAIGFDFDRGRLDTTAHPFCSGFGPGDCRLTTRYNEQKFSSAFFGVMHEAGHGIYEQGLSAEHFGTALGETVSLGIHESQSRLWENLVGRSRTFWQHFYPAAQAAFPEALASVALDDFHFAINSVRPSFIRVEADEVTYNLHVMLRFEIEQAIIAGDLPTRDIPGVWNETFQRYFGLTPPNDSLGCMQDIHWSAGLIGYFPTYALGNMYAAQFFEAADRQLGGLFQQFAIGEFQPLKQWLNQQIHSRGKRLRAHELVQAVTGEALTAKPLLRHLKARFGGLYGIGSK